MLQHVRGVTDGTRVGHIRNGTASVRSAATGACSRQVEARSAACSKQTQRSRNNSHET